MAPAPIARRRVMRAESDSHPAIPKPDSGGFVWPPREEGAGPTAAGKPHDQAGHGLGYGSGFANLLESIEVDLLGRTTLAFDRWAARTGWEPDRTDVYCWRCAGSIGLHESDGEGCADCRSKPLPWDRAIRLGVYRDDLRDEVIALKFHRWRPGGRGLGKFLGESITRTLEDAQVGPQQARLVPIPTHPIRRVMRGVDHTQVLARAAAEASGCSVARVLRSRYRPEQVGLSATARAANIRGAFQTRGRPDCDGIRVWVLIDDVRTTGATFVAASRALRELLKQQGASVDLKPEIWICSVAVSGSRRRRE